jgi:hypothetical protein
MMKLPNSSPREETTQCCGLCRYYQSFEQDEGIEEEEEDDEEEDDPEAVTGYCRRYPPHYFPNIPVAISAWPEVSGKKGWCGEFIPK